MKPSKRYGNDTITYINSDFITGIIDILSKFHRNIKLTFKEEHYGEISFLDVLLMVIEN